MEPGDYWVPPAESNIRNDVESANLILGCGVPVVMVPINVCRGDILTTEEEIEMLTASGPVGKFSVDWWLWRWRCAPTAWRRKKTA